MFAEKMLEFYKQRIKYNRDEYDKFDPDEIIKIKTRLPEKLILKVKIRSEFGLENYAETRSLGYLYLKKYGFDKILIYSIVACFGSWVIKLIRKINVIYKKTKQ